MLHKPEPTIFHPFSQRTLRPVQEHIKHVRKCFDWPGIAYHDKDAPENDKFNRWFWYNLPMLKHLHYDPNFIKLASRIFNQPLKPSYVFLSMYGPDGVCPVHTDRPQCQFTIDLQLRADGHWPIYVEDKQYILENGQALAYSGTGQVHYRKPMQEDGKCTFMDLAFFHFVPTSWQGEVK